MLDLRSTSKSLKIIALYKLLSSLLRVVFTIGVISSNGYASTYLSFTGFALIIGIFSGCYSNDMLLFADKRKTCQIQSFVNKYFIVFFVISALFALKIDSFILSALISGLYIGFSQWMCGLIRLRSSVFYELASSSFSLSVIMLCYFFIGLSGENSRFCPLLISYALSVLLIYCVFLIVTSLDSSCSTTSSAASLEFSLTPQLLIYKYAWEASYILLTRLPFFFYANLVSTIKIFPYVYFGLELVSMLFSQIQYNYLFSGSLSQNLRHLNSFFRKYFLFVLFAFAFLKLLFLTAPLLFALCASPNFASLYAPVSNFENFIMQKISLENTTDIVIIGLYSILMLLLQYLAYLRYAINLHNSSSFFIGTLVTLSVAIIPTLIKFIFGLPSLIVLIVSLLVVIGSALVIILNIIPNSRLNCSSN